MTKIDEVPQFVNLIKSRFRYVEYKDEDTYLADADIPTDEIIVCKLQGHLVAVVKGEAHDTWNVLKSKKPKPLLGYWVKAGERV